jgi:hypothetical protein
MAEPTEDPILQKARGLCRYDGKAWNRRDLKNGVVLADMFTAIADPVQRARYLKRARAWQKREWKREQELQDTPDAARRAREEELAT